MTKQIQWLEVWIDSASKGEYVLLLRSLANETLELIDPQENLKTVKVFNSYEDALHWLNEDEYDLVEGRWIPD